MDKSYDERQTFQKKIDADLQDSNQVVKNYKEADKDNTKKTYSNYSYYDCGKTILEINILTILFFY